MNRCVRRSWRYPKAIIHKHADISAFNIWPSGTIVLRLRIFPIKWQVENPRTGENYEITIHERPTSAHAVQEAWGILWRYYHREYPDQMKLDYTGRLVLGIFITTTIIRIAAIVTARFELKGKRSIQYEMAQ
jgi:hypothetical protein